MADHMSSPWHYEPSIQLACREFLKFTDTEYSQYSHLLCRTPRLLISSSGYLRISFISGSGSHVCLEYHFSSHTSENTALPAQSRLRRVARQRPRLSLSWRVSRGLDRRGARLLRWEWRRPSVRGVCVGGVMFMGTFPLTSPALF